MILAACANSATIDIREERNNWNVKIQYSYSDEQKEYNGKMIYTGEGDLETVSYRIQSPSALSLNADGYLDSFKAGEREVALGSSGGTTSGTNPEAIRDAINDSTIHVIWRTSEGEFEETISLSTSQ